MTKKKVNAAIQLALNDINLLRVLVHAQDAAAAYAVLRDYPVRITLSDPELNEFYECLKYGKSCITAQQLVDLYDGLQPRKFEKATRGTDGEWVPRG